MTQSQRRARVLLAEDNLRVREGLKRLIDDEADMEVIAETGDGQQALQLAQRLAPDVALVDVSMPGWDGVRLAREISGACPSVRIIAVTRHDDGGFVTQMMAAGARGYVLKQSDDDAGRGGAGLSRWRGVRGPWCEVVGAMVGKSGCGNAGRRECTRTAHDNRSRGTAIVRLGVDDATHRRAARCRSRGSHPGEAASDAETWLYDSPAGDELCAVRDDEGLR